MDKRKKLMREKIQESIKDFFARGKEIKKLNDGPSINLDSDGYDDFSYLDEK